MPRKAKDKDVENIEIIEKTKKKAVSSKSTTTKKSAKTDDTPKKKVASKSTTSKKSSANTSKEKTSAKSTTSKKISNSTDTSKKKTTTTKKETKSEKTASTKKEAKLKTTPKKKTSTKSNTITTKKKSSSSNSTSKKKNPTSSSAKKTTKSTKETIVTNPIILEYYDLPFKYGNTIVKLLAQTPKTLFVYWEISDQDIENYKKQFGDDFLNKTQPVLIVNNLTKNKSYNVEINDFANCWYLNIDDTDCEYDIELARIFIDNTNNSKNKNIIYIAKSNELQSPNDHIMFEKLTSYITFKDTNLNNEIKKDIKSFKFLEDIYEFYKLMYKDELLKNPSSNFLI